MGFIKKIKNILFEEEPIMEESVNLEKEKVVEKESKKNISPEKSSSLFDLIDDQPKKAEAKKDIFDSEEISDRDLFKAEKTFNFPVFDEEEFESTVPKVRSTQVITKEKPRKVEKRIDYPHYERTEEKKKFKPSPIISPVYGILDKDYSKEDIMPKRKEQDIPRRNELSIDSVRKKAFGNLEDEIEQTITAPREEFFQEVEQELESEIIPEVSENKKNIEELLKESAHEEIIVPSEEIKETKFEDIEEELEKFDDEEVMEPLDKKTELTEDDTLEQDLFELIDSMYDDRKEAN